MSTDVQSGSPEKLVQVRRCACVVKGGRRFSFTALVVVGNGRGQVGWGYGKAVEVPLAVELRFLDQYLDLQRMRFGDRLHTQVSAEPETLDCLVPRLILQPVVENALTHGIVRRAGIGHLDVSARQDGSMLHLSVDDDGAGFDAGEDELLREGVGLRNTRARLLHLYGDAASLDLVDAPTGGVSVRIAIPVRPVHPRAHTPAAALSA